MPALNLLEQRDPAVTEAAWKQFLNRRATMFKTTIFTCVAYGAVAAAMLLAVLFTDLGREVLTVALLPFTVAFTAGIVVVTAIMVVRLLRFRPVASYADPVRDAGACPDYWTMKETSKAELQGLPEEVRHLARYHCAPNPSVFDMSGSQRAADAGVMQAFDNITASFRPGYNMAMTSAGAASSGSSADPNDRITLTLRANVGGQNAMTNEVVVSPPAGQSAWPAAETVEVSFKARRVAGTGAAATLLPAFLVTYATGAPQEASVDPSLVGLTEVWPQQPFKYTYRLPRSATKVAVRFNLRSPTTTSAVQLSEVRITLPVSQAAYQNAYKHYLGPSNTGTPLSVEAEPTSAAAKARSKVWRSMYPAFNVDDREGSARIQCDRVYPHVLAGKEDARMDPRANAVRCAYKNACRIPWSSVCAVE